MARAAKKMDAEPIKRTSQIPKIGKPANTRKLKPARNPEDREKQMVSLAMQLAEKQLEEGTASSSVITHFLKLGTEKAKMEQLKMEKEITLLNAKTESIESGKQTKEQVDKAIEAMTRYAPSKDENL